MPFLRSLPRALSTATLLIALTSAQQCYYPDGSPSSDTPCASSGSSSCCGADSWCMDNGLCFAAGLVSRGSCTDSTWKSEACTTFCKSVNPSGAVSVTPCTTAGSFSCGLNSCGNSNLVFSMSGSGSLVLRANQVEALVAPALSSAEAQASASSTSSSTACTADPSAADATGLYTSGQMVGVGCGLGLPLLFALMTLAYMHNRHKQHHAREIYPPASPTNDIRLRPPMRGTHPSVLRTVSLDGSDAGNSVHSSSHSTYVPPEHMKTFFERHKSVREMASPPVRVREIRLELDGSEDAQRRPVRHELASTPTPTR